MDKADQSEDPRIQRTRKLIHDALIALTIEIGFPAITVRDITKRATINRSTFYRYYLDKYDLLDALSGDELIEDASADEALQEAETGAVRLLRYVQQRADFYQVMLGTRGDPFFIESFRQNLEKRFRKWPAEDKISNAPSLDLRANYVSYAGVGAIVWWLEHGQHLSPEQFAQWLSQLRTSVMEMAVKTL